MTGVWKWVVSSVIILIIGWGLYSLISAKNQLESQAQDLSAQFSGFTKENQALEDQTNYLKNPDNLVKELKEQTSYRLPDEKLIIITAGTASTTSTSTATSTK